MTPDQWAMLLFVGLCAGAVVGLLFYLFELQGK